MQLPESVKSAMRRVSEDMVTSLFFALYIVVALATFRHSAIGFASVEDGSALWGALSALAVDIGMMLSAGGLRKSRNVWLVLGLVATAAASTFSQLLFSVTHSQSLTVSFGAEWMEDVAKGIINARVVIMPLLLPFLSIVFAFSSKDRQREIEEHINEGAQTLLDKCIDAWVEHGTSKTAKEIALIVGCSVGTARKAKKRLGK